MARVISFAGLILLSLITLSIDSLSSPLIDALAVGVVVISLIMVVKEFIAIVRMTKRSIVLLAGKNETKQDIRILPKLIEHSNQKTKLISEHIMQLATVKDMTSVHESLLQDEAGIALQTVQQKIKTMKEDEDRQHWITEGLARFSEVLRKKDKMQEYCASIIGALVKYIGANQGALFLEYQQENERHLQLEGSYAYDKRRYQNRTIQLGEGLLGQCMFEKDIIFITDVPKDYVHITSGLGLATPRNIVIVPLMINDVFYGAIELASFEILKPYQVEFLRKVSVMIAAEIGAIKTLEHTQALLAESDEMSHRLKTQDEEMRMNMEELAATQEEMVRHQTELEKKQIELNSYLSAIDNTIASAEFSLHGDLVTANNLFLTITGYENKQIRDKSYTEIFKDDESLHVMWENLQVGKFFSGEFRMLDIHGKELWMNGTLNPILDTDGKPKKIMLFAQFTTQEKEKLHELNGTVQALKQALPFVEFNPQLQCKTANEKFLKMFGISRLDIKNKSICNFIQDKMFCDNLLGHQQTLMKDNQLNERLALDVSGSPQHWNVTFSIVRDLSGNISRILMMLVHHEKTILQVAI